MRTDRLFVIGAGGHAKVVLDALLASGTAPENICVCDTDPAKIGKEILGLVARGQCTNADVANRRFHVAIGDNAVRQSVYGETERSAGIPATVIHPAAVVAPASSVGTGSFIAARAVVAPAAMVGIGTIVNHGAIVDHDCVVGPFCHISPNATLAGGVRLGAGTLIGAGANILPGLSIGSGVTIGAGAVVTKNVPDGATLAGVPARPI